MTHRQRELADGLRKLADRIEREELIVSIFVVNGIVEVPCEYGFWSEFVASGSYLAAIGVGIPDDALAVIVKQAEQCLHVRMR